MDDVLIAGAGPAGAIAAIVLARAGARVRVFDRARFPRDKLCGDTLNPGALRVLSRLGLDDVTAGALPVDGMILTGAPGVTIVGRYGAMRGRAMTRRVLDAGLVEAAAGAGASIEEDVLVAGPLLDSTSSRPKVTGLQLQGRGGQPRPVHARIVVAADGRYSRVARALGLSYAPDRPRRWAVGAYFEDVGGLSTFGEMHVRSGHYLGVAPLPGGVTNACLVSTPHAALRDPSAYLLRALREDDRLGERFAGARLAGPAVSLGPLAVDCGVAGVEGLLLAGDAGGFVDPMTGDGLRFAFRGGEQAAAGALRALERGPASIHDELLLARRREFGRKWAFNRAIRRLVSSPAAIRGATLAASILPGAFELMVRYAGDTRSAEL